MERAWSLAFAALFPAAVLSLAGCASTGYDKSNATAYSMRTGALEVQAESRALEVAMNTLKDLVNNPGDLKSQYQRFSSALDRLDSCVKRTGNSSQLIQAKGAAYFQAWDRQLATIDYDHIRDLSQTRRTEVTNHFAAVTRKYKESQDVVQPLVSYLHDIRTALGADLTVAGVQSMKDAVANSDQNTAKVQTALAGLVTELANSSSSMSCTVAQRSTENGS